MSKAEFADALAHSLEERENLLKIMYMNHHDMEENSRIERLIKLKEDMERIIKIVRKQLRQH